MTEHNAEAVQAAVEAVLRELGKHFRQDDEHSKEWVRSLAFDVSCAAVDAATPGILAAAGKVMTEDQCRAIMRDTMAREMRTALSAELDRVEEAARASERERIAELADEHGVSYAKNIPGGEFEYWPFADLIRSQP